jgi:hypothetical protein
MCNNIQNVVAHLANLAAYPLKTTPAHRYMNRLSYTYYVYVYLSARVPTHRLTTLSPWDPSTPRSSKCTLDLNFFCFVFKTLLRQLYRVESLHSPALPVTAAVLADTVENTCTFCAKWHAWPPNMRNFELRGQQHTLFVTTKYVYGAAEPKTAAAQKITNTTWRRWRGFHQPPPPPQPRDTILMLHPLKARTFPIPYNQQVRSELGTTTVKSHDKNTFI